jgi:hypothetical protein
VSKLPNVTIRYKSLFKAVLEGKVPDGRHPGKKDKDGDIHHRPLLMAITASLDAS